MMRFSLIKIKSYKTWIIIFSTLYFIGIIVGLYKLMYQDKLEDLSEDRKEYPALLETHDDIREYEVEIWGKAAIGIYLWNHILGAYGPENHPNQIIQTDTIQVKNIKFTYRTGPGLVPNVAPRNVTRLVLVLNGRTEDKITMAKIWLDSLPAFEDLVNVVVVILGNEKCENEWILPYMKSRGGLVSACFLTYDTMLVDNQEFFQWPLGVATYRGFPDINPEKLDTSSSRPYLCNFLGTVYANSTREKLLKMIQSAEKLQDNCLVIGRQKWQPQETKISLQFYISSILKSDLTLNPVGFNTECYRIYESLSLGSVPVVEDLSTAGNCDRSALRLLKSYDAPMIYVKDWSELSAVLTQDSLLSISDKVFRRVAVIHWYANFKLSIRNFFIDVLNNKFRLHHDVL